MKYLAQAILIDNTGRDTIETVIDSIKTDNDRETVKFLMKRHRTNPHYLYVVMDIETQEVVIHTDRNIYYC